MIRTATGFLVLSAAVLFLNTARSNSLPSIVGAAKPDCNGRLWSEVGCYSPAEPDPIVNPCALIVGYNVTYGFGILNYNVFNDPNGDVKCSDHTYQLGEKTVTCAGGHNDWVELGTKRCNKDYFSLWIF